MKRFIGCLSTLLVLFSLSACGTLEIKYEDAPAPTAYVLPTPTPMTFGISPEDCSRYKNDVTLPPNPDEPGSYIGHHYDELAMPEGLAFNRSDPISDDNQYQREWVSRPDADMEFIVQINCRRTDGSLYSTVVDAIEIPREIPGYARAGYCLPDLSQGPIIIFGRYDTNQPPVALGGEQGWAMFNLDYGKTIDLQTMRFITYPLEGIQCLRLSRQGG